MEKEDVKNEKKARRYSPKGFERNTDALPIPKLSRAWTAPEPLPELTASMVKEFSIKNLILQRMKRNNHK